MVTQESYDKAVEALKILKNICETGDCSQVCPLYNKESETNPDSARCLLRKDMPGIAIQKLIKPEPAGLFTPRDVEFIESLAKRGCPVNSLKILKNDWYRDVHFNYSDKSLMVYIPTDTDGLLFPNIDVENEALFVLTAEQIQAEIAKVKGITKR